MHVLIVDDEPLSREELAYLVDQHPSVTSIETAESVEEAMNSMVDKKPDVLFLDIQLMGETGFDLAEKLLKLKHPPYLIFATAFDSYGVKAFEVNARDYILKPFEEEKIIGALDKAIANLNIVEEHVVKEEEKVFEAIPVYVEDRIYLIDPEEIHGISVEGRMISIHTKDKVYETTGTLHSLEKKLSPTIFFKTHRSYMINLTKIQEIQHWFNSTLQVTLTNGQKIPISRSYIKSIKEKIGLD